MNSAAAIYQNADAAQNVINASPLRFELKRAVLNSAATESSISMNTSAADEKHGNGSEAEDSDQKGEWLKPLQRGRSLMKEPGAGNMSLPGPNASPDGLNARYTQANSIPTSPPRTSKPFTSNPTPSSATPTSLPYPPTPASSSTKEVSKEFHLTIERSVLNHHAYIQCQHYYGGFELDKTHMMVQDLAARVPVRGMEDCQLDKGEVPLRVRVKRGGEAKGRETLRDLWNEGRRQRGEVHTHDSISEPMTP